MTALVIDDRYATLADCLRDLRTTYASHDDIAKLAGMTFVCTKPEWTQPVLDHLESILDDIGNCAMDQWDGARNAIANGPYLATAPNLDGFVDVLSGPAICLAAGPTAEAQMGLVRQHQDSHYIFAVDAMANACRTHGFVPHFTCLLERTPQNAAMVAHAGKAGSRLIAPPVADPAAAKAFGGKCLWWPFPGLLWNWLAPDHIAAYSGKSCGVQSIAAALLAGCNPVYLVGHDLAYADGKSHAASAHAAAPIEHQKPPPSDSHLYFSRRQSTTSSTGGTIETCGIWNQFRHDIEHLIALYPDRTVINCGGLSLITGAAPGKLEPKYLMVQEPDYVSPPIKDWSRETPRIVAGCHRVLEACAHAWTMEDPDKIGPMFRMSTLVDCDLAPLFNCIYRPIAETLVMRLNYRCSRPGFDAHTEHRSAAALMLTSTRALMKKMIEDLVTWS